MFEADKKAFAAMMNSICKLYNKPQMDPELMRLCWTALEHLTLDEVCQGLNLHVRNPDTGMFLPKPADIIRHIDGSGDTQAKVAWSHVDKAIREEGAWTSVEFPDEPRIHAVISDMGGWIKLCSTTEQEYPFKQNEFEKRYRGYLQRKPENYPATLVGIAQAQNEAQDFPIPSPVIIRTIANDNVKISLNRAAGGNMQIDQKYSGNTLAKKRQIHS